MNRWRLVTSDGEEPGRLKWPEPAVCWEVSHLLVGILEQTDDTMCQRMIRESIWRFFERMDPAERPRKLYIEFTVEGEIIGPERKD